MTRCRIPEICERYKIDIGIYNLTRRRILPRSVKHSEKCLYIFKNHYCVIKKKIDEIINSMG